VLSNALHDKWHCTIINIAAADIQASKQVCSLDGLSEFEPLAWALHLAEIIAGVWQTMDHSQNNGVAEK
jgi:hypothetical protein